MTQSEEFSKSFQECLRFLDHQMRFLSRSQFVPPGLSTPPAVPNISLALSGVSRKLPIWNRLSKMNTGSLTPMWRLAESAPKPPRGSAKQKIGLVRYLAGMRSSIPRPHRSAARPTAPTFEPIRSPRSAGQEPCTRTVVVAQGSRMLSGAQQEALRLRRRLPR